MHVYDAKEVQRLAGVSTAFVRSLTRAGHLKPSKGRRGKLQFSFQDLIVARAAHALTRSNIPARRINRGLQRLREQLPADIPLSGLAIVAMGAEIAVREGPGHREADSGQYLLELNVDRATGEVSLLEPGGAHGEPVVIDHYAHASELETSDAVAAIEAYQRCLAGNGGHLEARINCGRLLHLAGRLQDAERLYRDVHVEDATLLFNLAVLLEDLGRAPEAMEAYREALHLDPTLADAHFNLALLHQAAGNERDALRHLLAYRRLSSAA